MARKPLLHKGFWPGPARESRQMPLYDTHYEITDIFPKSLAIVIPIVYRYGITTTKE